MTRLVEIVLVDAGRHGRVAVGTGKPWVAAGLELQWPWRACA